MNQCDGCLRGIPIDKNRQHRVPEKPLDGQACTAHMYPCEHCMSPLPGSHFGDCRVAVGLINPPTAKIFRRLLGPLD